MSLDPRISDALDGLLSRLRADLDARVTDEIARLEASLAGDRRELEGRLSDERIAWQATLAAVKAEARDERVETFTRLLRSVRRLDEAASLTAILEVLAKGAVAEAARVAVFIVEPDVLRSWGHFGFADGQGPTDITTGLAPALADAVNSQQTSILSAADIESTPDLPPFMRPAAGHVGLVAPLTVGGETVAILYAEGAERRSEEDEAAVWAEEVELLVRHAAARLENVTSERTVAALTRTV